MFCTVPLFAQKWREMSEDVNANYYDVKKEGDAYYSVNPHGKGTGYKQFQRWLFYMKNHIDSLGNQINKDEAYGRIEEANSRLTKNNRVKATGANWTQMGPTSWKNSGGWAPGLGRLEAVRVDSKNQNNIYVGSPGGGAWKTTDGGANWKAITDYFSPSAMFVWAIGLADGSPDSVYVGTESGILYSYNGGTSFTKATGISGTVRRIEVHPTNHKIILAATTSAIYRSTNAGQSWTSVRSGAAYDLRFKPDNTQVVYACGSGFYKSTDGGLTFTTISMGSTGTKRLAVTAAMPNYVYVAELNGQAFGAMYRSTDAGTTFTTRVQGGGTGTKYGGYNPDGNDAAGQGSYNFCLAASPTNADEVHLGCIITWKSTNGGTSFAATTEWTYPNNTGYTHCDMHQLEYVGNTLYTGSDGGIFKSTDAGNNFTNISTGLCTRMYYHIGQSATDQTMVGGGAQDNGCNLFKNNVWYDWVSADGMNTVIDWSNANIVYGMTQEGVLYKSTNAGASTVNISSPGGGWTNALCQDTKVANTLYFGGTSLYKTTNGGGAWTNIGTYGGQIEDVEVAPSDNNYVYLCSGSALYYSANAGVSFTKGTGISGSISQIAASHTDPKKVYAATSSGVFMSINGGATWTNITGALPNLGAGAICVDDNADEGIYVAISYSVYYKNKNMAWVQFSDKLPLVDIRQLEYHKLAKKVRVGTYGRGIWETPAYNPVETKPAPFFTADVTSGCKKVKVKFTNNTLETMTAVKWSFPGGTPSTSTNKDTVTVTYTGKGFYDVKLVATNNAGKDSLTKLKYISVEEMALPVSSGLTFCIAGPVTINATKTNGNINWYAANDTLKSVYSGDNYTTSLQQSTNFYINTTNGGSVLPAGPGSSTIGDGANHSGGQYLIFTAYKSFVLKSVKVTALGTKSRTITLKDNTGTLIDSKIVNIVDGESVVILNWTIPVGVDMQIGVDAGSDLFRNSTGGIFPYTIENLVSITANSAGAGYEPYYYYFYDWKVQEPSTCASKMVKVTATKDVCTDINEVLENNFIYPNPVYDELHLSIQGQVKATINTQDGKFVKQLTLEGSNKVIDVRDLAKGIYMISLEYNNSKNVYKLVK